MYYLDSTHRQWHSYQVYTLHASCKSGLEECTSMYYRLLIADSLIFFPAERGTPLRDQVSHMRHGHMIGGKMSLTLAGA